MEDVVGASTDSTAWGDELKRVPSPALPSRLHGSWLAESHTRPAREKQGGLIVPIHLPTEHSPRQQWRVFYYLLRLVGLLLSPSAELT